MTARLTLPERSQRGVALVMTLLALGLFSALGAGLALTASVERLTTGNHADAVMALYAADAALELAAGELAAIADWDEVLTGSTRSRFTDGPPGGVHMLPGGGSVNLTSMTNELSCGRPTRCSDAQIGASTPERPWGSNNPRWQPFLFGTLGSIGTPPRLPASVYVIVWIGDDAREVDGDPQQDGGGAAGEGRYALRARAEAFGPGPTRRSLEADLVRVCRDDDGEISCQPGIRVQSWRLRLAAIP